MIKNHPRVDSRLSLAALRITCIADKVARARTENGAVKALDDGHAWARFEADIAVEGDTPQTVTGTWTAMRHQDDEVALYVSEGSKRLDAICRKWGLLISDIAVRQSLLANIRAKLAARQQQAAV